MATIEVEKRIDDLEAKISKQLQELGDQIAKVSQSVSQSSTPDNAAWWTRVVGIYENDPAFDEAERLAKQYKNSLDGPSSKTDS